MSKRRREKLVNRIHIRDLTTDRTKKGRIFDEVVTTTVYHRKHTIRLLKRGPSLTRYKRWVWKRTCSGETVRQLVFVWKVVRWISGKHPQPFLPKLVAALERHSKPQDYAGYPAG